MCKQSATESMETFCFIDCEDVEIVDAVLYGDCLHRACRRTLQSYHVMI